MFLFITLIASMLLTGCGDDKKTNSPSGPEIDPTDYNYYFGISSIVRDGRDNEYLVAVSSYDGTAIASAEVTVAGQTYTLENAYGILIGYVTLPQIGAYSYEVVIDGNKEFNFNLAPAPVVEAQWPQTIMIGEDFDVSWSLSPNQDPQVQEFSGYAYDEMGDEEDHFETLSTSARSYTVPGNWFSTDMTSYEYDLIAVNYATDGEMIGVSVEGSFIEYYAYGKSTNKPLDYIKKAVDKFVK